MEGFPDIAEYALFQSAIFLIVIAVWGFWKYRERELLHKQAIAGIRKNVPPLPRRRATWLKVATTGAVFIVLALAVMRANLLLFEMVGFLWDPLTYLVYPFLVELSLVAALFLAMMARDIRSLLTGG